MASEWEDLRKQARKLENEIDSKLVTFGKIGSNPTQAYKNENSDREPLLHDDMLDSMGQEIEHALSKLSSINEKMGEICENNELVNGPAIRHTLQRHRDIFQDYSQEFRKISVNVKARKEREDLLHNVRKDIDMYKTSSGLNRRSDLYMKENEHIRNSDRMISEQINIAIETKDHLTSQRHNLKRIQTRIHDISSRFPLVNNLIQRINSRKRRNSIIVASVITLCTFLILLYTLKS